MCISSTILHTYYIFFRFLAFQTDKPIKEGGCFLMTVLHSFFKTHTGVIYLYKRNIKDITQYTKIQT